MEKEYPSLDLHETAVEVHIRQDGSVLWVNTGTHCVLRICGIKTLLLHDDRRK